MRKSVLIHSLKLNESQSQFIIKPPKLGKNHYHRNIQVMGRREQQTLSEYLFGKKIFDACGICHQRLPVSFLVTAHIKKRTICSHDERINPYIVMPMCKLGCDELYEQGYIGVKEGKVVSINQSHTTVTIEAMKKAILGNRCSYYKDETRDYFDWHLKEHNFQ